MTFQSGSDIDVRAQFINNGHLLNTQDTNFRAVSDNWPVFGLAHDFGNITKASPVVFSVGNIRDPVLQYIVANDEIQPRNLLFWSEFRTPAALVSHLISQGLLCNQGDN